MEQLSKHELRLLKHREKGKEEVQKKPFPIKLVALALAFILLIAGSGYGYYVYRNSPGAYDDFAKCLSERGAIMYGAIEWCKYTKEQAAMFGKSFKYINYKNYKEGPDIKTTPTWIINNERYERVQSFEKLSSLTGCKV